MFSFEQLIDIPGTAQPNKFSPHHIASCRINSETHQYSGDISHVNNNERESYRGCLGGLSSEPRRAQRPRNEELTRHKHAPNAFSIFLSNKKTCFLLSQTTRDRIFLICPRKIFAQDARFAELSGNTKIDNKM